MKVLPMSPNGVTHVSEPNKGDHRGSDATLRLPAAEGAGKLSQNFHSLAKGDKGTLPLSRCARPRPLVKATGIAGLGFVTRQHAVLNVGAGLRTATGNSSKCRIAVRRPAPTFLSFSRFMLSGDQKPLERLPPHPAYPSKSQLLDSASQATD